MVAHFWLLLVIIGLSQCMGIEVRNLVRVSWLFYLIIVTSATLVTFGYYLLGYQQNDKNTWFRQLADIHIHALNSLVILNDVFLLSYPVYILQFVYIVLFFLLYTSFTFIFWLIHPEKNIIYEQLDYSNPLLALFHIIVSFLTSFLFHIIHFFLVQLKARFFKIDGYQNTYSV